MAVTINDVAKDAGVSIATVSRVVNGKAVANEILRKKVLKSIDRLGYVPNSNAQSLKQDCSKLIGITTSDLSVSFFPAVVKHIEKTFLPAGYATLVSSTYDESRNEKNILQHMVSRRVDALLVNSTGENEDRLKLIEDSGIPILLYDRRSHSRSFPAVYMDKQKAVYQAMEHLYSLGHQRVALVTGPNHLTSNDDRYMGVQRYVLEHDVDPSHCLSYFGTFTQEYGEQIMDEIIHLKERPTAIITGSIAITAGIMFYCREHNLSIPRDLALVSSGNFIYDRAVNLDLSYIDDRVDAVSENLINMIQRVLQGEKLSADDQVILEPALRIGASTLGQNRK